MTQEQQKAPEKPVFGVSGRKIIYDKDGKPCRACNSLLDFQAVTSKKPAKQGTGVPATTNSQAPVQKETQPPAQSEPKLGGYTKDYPPDVEVLGRSSWTLLHSIAARYPEEPSTKEQKDLSQFLKLFGNFYPCWYCGEDFGKYMGTNEPKVTTQEEFGRWLCDAHNEVNAKLGKPKFNCDLWKKRWKDGWDE